MGLNDPAHPLNSAARKSRTKTRLLSESEVATVMEALRTALYELERTRWPSEKIGKAIDDQCAEYRAVMGYLMRGDHGK